MWIKIGDRTINAANIAVYGVDEGTGDSYVIWVAGHKTAYRGRQVAEALDEVIKPVSGRLVAVVPTKPLGSLPGDIAAKAQSRNGGQR